MEAFIYMEFYFILVWLLEEEILVEDKDRVQCFHSNMYT